LQAQTFQLSRPLKSSIPYQNRRRCHCLGNRKIHQRTHRACYHRAGAEVISVAGKEVSCLIRGDRNTHIAERDVLVNRDKAFYTGISRAAKSVLACCSGIDKVTAADGGARCALEAVPEAAVIKRIGRCTAELTAGWQAWHEAICYALSVDDGNQDHEEECDGRERDGHVEPKYGLIASEAHERRESERYWDLDAHQMR